MNLLRLCVLAVGCFALPLALPVIKDIHATKVDVSSTKAPKYTESSHFVVEVSRLDELVETDTNEKKAVRATVVILEFDVTPSGDVVLNKVPVPMGVSNVVVDAATVMKTIGDFSEQEARQDFDIGIIGVEVYAKGQTITEKGSQFRRIQLIERITSINGQTVEQDTLVQQWLDVLPDGTILKTEPADFSREDFDKLRVNPFPNYLIAALVVFQCVNLCLSFYVWRKPAENSHAKVVCECHVEEPLPQYETKEVKYDPEFKA